MLAVVQKEAALKKKINKIPVYWYTSLSVEFLR